MSILQLDWPVDSYASLGGQVYQKQGKSKQMFLYLMTRKKSEKVKHHLSERGVNRGM